MRAQRQTSIEVDSTFLNEINMSLSVTPLKALAYMLGFARQFSKKLKNKKHYVSLYSRRINSEFKFSKAMAKMASAGDFDTTMFYKSIPSAVYAYVSFFYALDKKELEQYVSMFDAKDNSNMLLKPALLALGNEKKSAAIKAIESYIYSIPFFMMQSTVSTILNIMQFESSTAIRGIPQSIVDKMESSLLQSGSIIKSMESFKQNPALLEASKLEMAKTLAELAAHDSYAGDIIKEMVDVQSSRTAKLFRIVRKKL
ncbi:MAG: hypothetical protein ACP5RM_03665 [Candidatus Micrarchaeia archaeon]